MKRCQVLVAAVAAVLAMAGSVRATEGGGGAYPNGAEGFMSGAVPPPGNYLIDYSLYYTADKFLDGNGDELLPNFDLLVAGNIVRLLHVTKTHVLGGLWAQQIFVPFLYVDVDHPMLGQDDQFGLGDIIVDPAVIAWHSGKFFVAGGVDVYVPVGQYDAADLANLGRNYWTFEPVLACSYLDAGYDLSAKVMYDYNLQNPDTDITSGDEFHVDFAAGKAFKRVWKAGVGGFYYQQLSDDEYPAGTPLEAQLGKGRQTALGPEVTYRKGNLSFTGKYQVEFDTENRPEGDRFWLKIVASL